MPDDFATDPLMQKAPLAPAKEKKPSRKPKKTLAPKMRIPPQGITYLSKKKNLRIRVKPTKKILLGTETYRERGHSIQFLNHRFVAREERDVKALDDMLTSVSGAYWRQRFNKMPDKRVVDVMSHAVQKSKEVEKQILEQELSKDDKTQYDEFQSFLKSQKEKTGKLVQGMRAQKNV
jgi:hypothetical protein